MTRIKSLMYILPLVATLLMGCGPGGNSFRIKGEFADMTGSELYMYSIFDDEAHFDTITVQEGKFVYQGECKDITPYILVFPNAVEQVIFVAPGKSIDYEASSNGLKNYTVKGTDENDLMNEFRKSTEKQTEAQTQATALKFIKENPASIVSTYLFDRFFVQDRKVSHKEISNILSILKAAQPQNEYLLNIEGKIKVLQGSSVGKTLPDMDLYGIKHHKCKLWKGKKDQPTLIVFWASWATQGNDMLWKMREIKRMSNDTIRGRFVGISLDAEYFRYEGEFHSDSVNGIEEYCDGLSFESPVVKKLGIPTVPYYIITDKKHKIVATGKHTEDLGKDIKKYLR